MLKVSPRSINSAVKIVDTHNAQPKAHCQFFRSGKPATAHIINENLN